MAQEKLSSSISQETVVSAFLPQPSQPGSLVTTMQDPQSYTLPCHAASAVSQRSPRSISQVITIRCFSLSPLTSISFTLIIVPPSQTGTNFNSCYTPQFRLTPPSITKRTSTLQSPTSQKKFTPPSTRVASPNISSTRSHSSLSPPE
ncbi:hypothetical protein TNCT_229971 [Trichonephila clavata]|uniref:Uncharacterized protein n=1 Tax=Trichonephila clavata TaxID=2740835 RepID=A0A8X6KJX1_TRICU|nr:hypothetical protein TNCT_229971 [Trichonephila clavata]